MKYMNNYFDKGMVCRSFESWKDQETLNILSNNIS